MTGRVVRKQKVQVFLTDAYQSKDYIIDGPYQTYQLMGGWVEIPTEEGYDIFPAHRIASLRVIDIFEEE